MSVNIRETAVKKRQTDHRKKKPCLKTEGELQERKARKESKVTPRRRGETRHSRRKNKEDPKGGENVHQGQKGEGGASHAHTSYLIAL